MGGVAPLQTWVSFRLLLVCCCCFIVVLSSLSLSLSILKSQYYLRTGFNCVVQLLRLSLLSYITNLIIASAQIACRGGLLIE